MWSLFNNQIGFFALWAYNGRIDPQQVADPLLLLSHNYGKYEFVLPEPPPPALDVQGEGSPGLLELQPLAGGEP